MSDPAPSDDVQQILRTLRDEVTAHTGDRPDDEVARIVTTSAIDAGSEGNAAVGALLVGPDGDILASDRNRMFVPAFRSDFHAEMVLLSGYEQAHPDWDPRGCTLVTSLEPCEMCMIRIINSGVSAMRYVAADLGKGSLTGPNQLAPHWARLAEPQHFAVADCDSRLGEIALEAFETTIGGVSARLMARRVPPEPT